MILEGSINDGGKAVVSVKDGNLTINGATVELD